MLRGHGPHPILAIGMDPAPPQPVRQIELGLILVGQDRCSRSRSSRRSTALAMPLPRPSPTACARSTAVATAACAGVSRNMSCAAPSRSRFIRASGRRGSFGVDQPAQSVIDLAQPPDSCRRQQPGEGAVPRFHVRLAHRGVDRLVQRPGCGRGPAPIYRAPRSGSPAPGRVLCAESSVSVQSASPRPAEQPSHKRHLMHGDVIDQTGQPDESTHDAVKRRDQQRHE